MQIHQGQGQAKYDINMKQNSRTERSMRYTDMAQRSCQPKFHLRDNKVVVNMGIIYLLRIKSVQGWQSIRQRVCRDLCTEQLPIL